MRRIGRKAVDPIQLGLTRTTRGFVFTVSRLYPHDCFVLSLRFWPFFLKIDWGQPGHTFRKPKLKIGRELPKAPKDWNKRCWKPSQEENQRFTREITQLLVEEANSRRRSEQSTVEKLAKK